MFKHCLYRLLLLFQQIAVSAEHEDSQVGYLGDCVKLVLTIRHESIRLHL